MEAIRNIVHPASKGLGEVAAAVLAPGHPQPWLSQAAGSVVSVDEVSGVVMPVFETL